MYTPRRPIASLPTSPSVLPSDPIARQLALGDVVADRYLVTQYLGTGGTSMVYAAQDKKLERPVALKVLGTIVRDPKRFAESEARAMSGVRSPHVVAVHDLLSTEYGPVIVMELVEGETLEAKLETGLPIEESLLLLSRIADGLDEIHRAGLVHGDIKPSNVLVDVHTAVKITDFGLRAMIDEVQPGRIVGTPRYLAPERILASYNPNAPQRLTRESDIYSFAVMAFEMLTGRPPFICETTPEYFMQHANTPAPRASTMSALSSAFDSVFAAGLAKDPARRPIWASDFVHSLVAASQTCDASGRGIRILVVDDDDDLRALLAEYVGGKLSGAEIATAPDGAAALKKMTEFAPTVAIVDLGLPGMSGIDLVREMMDRQPDLRIIVMTGHGSGPEWRTARALGARKFLIKPVPPSELVECVLSLA